MVNIKGIPRTIIGAWPVIRGDIDIFWVHLRQQRTNSIPIRHTDPCDIDIEGTPFRPKEHQVAKVFYQLWIIVLYLIDFNRAYHPYCYYNPRFDCPYPPAQNRLPVPVRAGERMRAQTSAGS